MKLEDKPNYSPGIYYARHLRSLVLVKPNGIEYLSKNSPRGRIRLVPLKDNLHLLFNTELLRTARTIVAERGLEEQFFRRVEELKIN